MSSTEATTAYPVFAETAAQIHAGERPLDAVEEHLFGGVWGNTHFDADPDVAHDPVPSAFGITPAVVQAAHEALQHT